METKLTKEELEKAFPKKGTKTWAKAKVTMEVSPRLYIVAPGDGARCR
jgi:hypothetical protein